MPENSSLIALRVLEEELRTTASFEASFALVSDFVEAHLAADVVALAPAGAGGGTGGSVLHFPLDGDGTGMGLTVQRAASFSPDEEALASLTATLLGRQVTEPALASFSGGQLQLLERVGRSVAGHSDVEAVFEVLAEGLPAVFPGLTACIFLLEEDELRWRASLPPGADRCRSGPAFRAQAEQVLARGEVVLLGPEGRRMSRSQVGTLPFKQALLPITVKGAPAGVFQVQCGATPPRPEQTLRYLEVLAGYVGIALQTNQLVQEAWQRTNQLETIYNVTESVRALKPLQATLADIHTQLRGLFDARSFFITLYDTKRQMLTFPYAVDSGEELDVPPIPLSNGNSLVAWVVLNNRPYVTPDWAAEDETPVRGVVSGKVPRSVVCFPLRAGDRVVGALSVQSDQVNAFDEDAYHLLASIAGHVAVIVQNAHLYSTTQDLVDTLAQEYLTAAALRKAVAVMATSLDLDAVLEHLLLALGDLVNYDSASIGLMERGEIVFRTHRSQMHDGERIMALMDHATESLRQNPLMQRVLKEQEPIYVADVVEDPRWEVVEGIEYVRSWIGVPLMAGEAVLGVLTVDHSRPGVYGEREIWLISTLASHASLAVQNARLHEEVQQQLQELSTLYEASAHITANLEQETVLPTVVREMVRALKVDSGTIFEWDAAQETLRVAAHDTLVALDRGEPVATTPVSAIGLSTIEDLGTHPVIQDTFARQTPYNVRDGAVQDEEEAAFLEAAGLKSVLLVPLVRRDRILGLLAMGQVDRPRTFGRREIRLARNLAAQAAVAVEHARLFMQAQRRIDELSTFHEIVLQLNMPLELENVLENITEAALRLIEASNLHIYLYDDDLEEFTFCSALWQDGRRDPAVSSPRPDGLTATVVHSAEAIVIDDAPNHPLYQDAEPASWGIHAIAGFPLMYAGNVTGVFTVTYLEPHTFTDDELLLMNLLADQAAVAVENAGLFAEAQSRLRSMSALVEMAKQVTGNLKVGAVLQTTVQTLQSLLDARASTIALLSEDGSELVVEAGAGIRPEYQRVRMNLGESVSGRAVAEQRQIYIRDTYEQPDFLFFDEVVRSLLVVPLVTRDEVIGTMTVDSDQPDAFSESDIQLMTIAAAQVSIAIANAGFFEELEARADELAQAYEELKESDRLKDELVQNVSHELRTPLTFVRGYVDLLMDGEMGALAPEQQRALEIVSNKTNEVTRLVADIMALQRISEENLLLEPFPMAQLIETAVDCHRLTADQQGLELRKGTVVGEGVVYADRGRINQVLDNLIGNAMKFSPDGGTIKIVMEEREEDVLVGVMDEGIGVAEEQVARIFDRFYQVDGSPRRRFGGAGIGLAIVKRIVDAHHGDIWVDSEPNQGSTFYFTLPKAE